MKALVRQVAESSLKSRLLLSSPYPGGDEAQPTAGAEPPRCVPQMQRPPSTSMQTPVTKDASSEQR